MPSRFESFLQTMLITHTKKSHDYSEDLNKFSNFEFTAELIKHFTDPNDQVFATMIGIKISRLIALQGKRPLNESRTDTYIDLANYILLWAEYDAIRSETQDELRQR